MEQHDLARTTRSVLLKGVLASMGSPTSERKGWLFEVQITERRDFGQEVILTTHKVRIPDVNSRVPATEIAQALLRAVLASSQGNQPGLFDLAPNSSAWQLRFASKGAVDEFTLGVQAVYLNPNSEVVCLFGMHFPEEVE
jgi:hypothetical protein